MDILREMDEQELDFVIKKFEEHLPYTIKDLHFILGSRRSLELSRNFKNFSARLLPTFYTHREGLKENCTIFGVTGDDDHTVWFFTFEESLEELTECLEQTKLIKWNEKVLFVTIHKEHTKAILECVTKNNYHLQSDEHASYYWLPKEKVLQIQIEIPEGTYLRQLKEEDSKLCNDIWEYKSSGSEAFIRSLILGNGGWALYDKSSDELLTYAVINEQLATGMLNTVTHARGKGFGELVSKVLTVKIAELFDLHPICFINSLNVPSMKLYAKLGYEKAGDSNWIVVGTQKH